MFPTNLKLWRQLVGMQMNCSSAGLSREKFTKNISIIRQHFLSVPPRTLFCPKPAFTNRVVWSGEDDTCHYLTKQVWNTESAEGSLYKEDFTQEVMVRTKNPADGGIVRGEKRAVAFFNADCPIVVLTGGIKKEVFEGEHNKLAVLHAGFRTLIREDTDEPNIIESAMKYFNPEYTRAFIGYGIGPCCWVPEYKDKPEILDPSKSRHAKLLAASLAKTTDASPFGASQISVDLYKLAKGLLMEVGIPENKILVNNRCTCCAQENGKPLFWSHNRFKAGKQEVDGRNMAMAFLTRNLENDGFETL